MAKKSLIKKTDKEKASSEKGKEEKKAKPAKKSTKAKKTAKKDAPAKKKAATKQKTTKAKTEKKTVKPKTAAKPKKTTRKKTDTKAKTGSKKTAVKTKKTVKKKTAKRPKKLSLKELVFKKFDSPKPKQLYKPDTPKAARKDYTAPPFISGTDKDEVKRMKSLLLKTFNMAEIVEAGKKASAERAAAEKAAAEKAAAEKAAAEKAAAEKAAAEKAAAEKAAAEKAAAEKAAAEKAAAEKAAAEKAAAEKAAAEKAAAEKAAAEKAAAEKVSVSYDAPSFSTETGEPEDKTVQYALTGLAAGVALIFLMVILASISNMGNFYLAKSNGSLEIWQGKFAPLGEKMILTLPGVETPGALNRTFSKQEVFPIAFDFFIDKADNLLETKGIPNFEKIKFHLNTALTYAVTGDLRQKAQSRLNHIDLMLLIYKASVLADRASIEDLDKALTLLDQAAVLAAGDEAQVQRINQKVASAENRIRALEAAAVEAAETAAAEEKATVE